MAKLSDLTPDIKNPNAHSEKGRKSLDTSLQKFGFREAGVIDRNNKIVGGNHRAEAAAALEMEDIVIVDARPSRPVFIRYNDLDLDDPDNPARAISVALNKVATDSITWDADILAMLALEGSIDLEDWFTDAELKALIDDKPALVHTDESLQDVGSLESGDIIELPSRNGGNHLLMVGDATPSDFAPDISVILSTTTKVKFGLVDRINIFSESGYPKNIDIFLREFTMVGDVIFANLTKDGDPLFACEQEGRILMGGIKANLVMDVCERYEQEFGVGLTPVKKTIELFD